MLATPAELEDLLLRHVIDVWFPRSLDVDHGGFLCDFDREWKPCGPHEKFLEFQARQTLVAAQARRVFPADERLERAVRHGFACLRDAMWDAQEGGWFHRLDRAGRPLEGHTKHAHGAAYAIQAAVAVHEATGDPAALEHARAGFAWLEEHAHDREHGGYFGFLTRDGRIIRDVSEAPWPIERDTIDTPIGLKDLNVHSDLAEAFLDLAEPSGDPKVAERLAEVVELMRDKALRPSGELSFFVSPDWQPVPYPPHFGAELQTAYRFLLCAPALGDEERLRDAARQLVDHARRHGSDERSGGFFAWAPSAADGVVARGKQWWVQTEALKAMLLLAQEDERYVPGLEAHFRYLVRNFIDTEHGGMFWLGLETLPAGASVSGDASAAAFTRKGGDWKDASHDGRAWLRCLSVLDDRP